MSLNELPSVIDTEILAQEAFFQLRKEKLKIPNQEDYNYYTLVGPPYAVMVLATTAQNDFVLNWEYRHAVRQTLLSCPGGIMHRDETAAECGQRELLEETGYTAEHFEVMGEAFPFPGVCTQKIIYVRAHNAIFSQDKQLEHAELIETELFSQDKLQKALADKVPTDGLLLTALFFCEPNKLSNCRWKLSRAGDCLLS